MLAKGLLELGKPRASNLVFRPWLSESGMGKESVTFSKRSTLLGLLVAFVLSVLPPVWDGCHRQHPFVDRHARNPKR